MANANAMSESQKLAMLFLNLLLAAVCLFLYSRGQFGICFWTWISNELVMYRAICAWNAGALGLNGMIFYRKEDPRVFAIAYCFYLVVFVTASNFFAVAFLLGWINPAETGL